ncbi:MAG TPA: DMT family transporter [Candidatus Avidesulfovibrio excrementigallinarum]|nr:DMT family transporter [Candidatus Avidesulfovibrio excrementigallinarum]
MSLGPNAFGLSLAILTALFWGALPLALKNVLTAADAFTIVCLRFWVAAAWVWLCPMTRNARRAATPWNRRDILLLVIATVGLGSNFVLFNSSVAYLSASACQILAQAGPVLLLVGSVVVLREPFLPIQGLGVVILLAGMTLFFGTRLGDLAGNGSFLLGLFLGISAAVVWACYGLAQKVLLRSTSPTRIMRVIYPCCALALTPLASPAGLLNANAFQIGCLLFACLNTIIAYGAFAKAMSCWHAAKVSAIVTTTPLFTMALETLGHAVMPAFWPAEAQSLTSVAGAIIAVLGALGIALGPMIRLPHAALHRFAAHRRDRKQHRQQD